MPRTKERREHAGGWHQQKQLNCPECWPFARMAEEREDAKLSAVAEALAAFEAMMFAFDIGQRAGPGSAIGLGRAAMKKLNEFKRKS